MSSTSLVIPSALRPSTAARVLGRTRMRIAALTAAATFVIAAAGLIATHTTIPPAVPQAVALRAVLADPAAGKMLAPLHWTRTDVTAMDRRYELLGFYQGSRMVAQATVGFNGHVVIIDMTDLARQKFAYGSNIANSTWVLALLTVLFVLMTAVWPWRRVRNLDVLVVVSTVMSVVFFNRWMLTRMVLVTYPALIYLAIRCAWWGLRGSRQAGDQVPLFDHLTRGWGARERRRTLLIGVGALALITAMVGFTSLNVLDVGYAVMEGATDIVHGVLPYGHIPDVLHGDTYPIGSYLLYAPLAPLWPVYSAWDDADPTLVVALVSALVIAGGLWRLARQPRAKHRPDQGGDTAGPRAAIAALAFPPLLVTVSTGTTDVVLGAMLVAALLLWHRPAWGGVALSCAAWFKLTPLAIVPVLLARSRGRDLARAVAALLATSAAMLGFLVAIGGIGAPVSMVRAMSFQFTRSSPHTLWAVVGSVPFQQLCEAATVALVLGTAIRLRRDPALAHDRTRIAAVVAAILLGVQISANYWNYMYLTWVLPFLVVWLFDQRRPDVPAADPLPTPERVLVAA